MGHALDYSGRPATAPLSPRGRGAGGEGARKGFTLVELLTVIVIIGMLVGMITAAAIAARNAANRAAIRMEIAQLDAALGAYKDKYGEYPPDFAGVNDPAPPIRLAVRNAVERHLRSAFPRYNPPIPFANATFFERFAEDVRRNYTVNSVVLVDPYSFDAASALVFFLGGLPESIGSQWTPAGFNANPSAPFQIGGSRTGSFFEFAPERLQALESTPWGTVRYLRYYPPKVASPYVYFKSRRDASPTLPAVAGGTNRHEYGMVPLNGAFTPLTYVHGSPDGNSDNVCVAYQDAFLNGNPTLPSVERVWRNPETYQILTAGLDGLFDQQVGGTNYAFRYTRLGQGYAGGLVPWSKPDNDNQTNFTTGRLEDELQ